MTAQSSQSYAKGTLFGNFMRRALPKKATNLPGMKGDEFKNLIASESGSSSVSHLGSTQKQLEGIKKLMHKAMDAFLVNKKLDQNLLPALNHLKEQIDESPTSTELYEIIEQAIDATQDLLKP